MREFYPNELYHYGILGMKWGVRRYQNEDRTLTEAGKKRYKKEERVKEAIVKSGSGKLVKRNQSKLSQSELDEALKRIDSNARLDELSNRQREAGRARLDSVIKAFGTLKSGLENVKGAYNIAAQVHNSLDPASKAWPIIGEKKEGPSLDDQIKLYNLNRTKQKNKREDEFETLLRTKDPSYFREHANDFSTEELRAVAAREDFLKEDKKKEEDRKKK